MNILGLISQLIGIKTLRLTIILQFLKRFLKNNFMVFLLLFFSMEGLGILL